MEVIPDFLGNPEEMLWDPLINNVVVRHRGPLNREQLAHRPSNAPRLREIRDELIDCDICHRSGCVLCDGTGEIQREPHRMRPIMVVAPDDWSNSQAQKSILREIWSGEAGYPDEFYAYKDTYREGAGECFNRHGRPADGCIDWHDHSKRLTDREWQSRGALAGEQREHVYLCEFCPVASWVVTQLRLRRGDYDK